MISPTAAYELDNEGKLPTTYCEYTTEPGWEMRTWTVKETVLTHLIDAIKERMKEEFWIYTYNDPLSVKEEEQLNQYANDFRIVFWFDS